MLREKKQTYLFRISPLDCRTLGFCSFAKIPLDRGSETIQIPLNFFSGRGCVLKRCDWWTTPAAPDLISTSLPSLYFLNTTVFFSGRCENDNSANNKTVLFHIYNINIINK